MGRGSGEEESDRSIGKSDISLRPFFIHLSVFEDERLEYAAGASRDGAPRAPRPSWLVAWDSPAFVERARVGIVDPRGAAGPGPVGRWGGWQDGRNPGGLVILPVTGAS